VQAMWRLDLPRYAANPAEQLHGSARQSGEGSRFTIRTPSRTGWTPDVRPIRDEWHGRFLVLGESLAGAPVSKGRVTGTSKRRPTTPTPRCSGSSWRSVRSRGDRCFAPRFRASGDVVHGAGQGLEPLAAEVVRIAPRTRAVWHPFRRQRAPALLHLDGLGCVMQCDRHGSVPSSRHYGLLTEVSHPVNPDGGQSDQQVHNPRTLLSHPRVAPELGGLPVRNQATTTEFSTRFQLRRG
jgi:hypothetical protein